MLNRLRPVDGTASVTPVDPGACAYTTSALADDADQTLLADGKREHQAERESSGSGTGKRDDSRPVTDVLSKSRSTHRRLGRRLDVAGVTRASVDQSGRAGLWHANGVPLMVSRVMISIQFPSPCVVGHMSTECGTAHPMALVNLTLMRESGRRQCEQQKQGQDDCEDSELLHF